MPFMGDQTGLDIPVLYHWDFADASARAVATDPITGLAYASSSIGMVARQYDTTPPTFWILTATTPTWTQIFSTPASAASGDLWYWNGSAITRLAKGTARQQLNMNSGATAPEWATSPHSLMTAQGDILQASAANTPARLAIGTARQIPAVNSGATALEYVASPQSLMTEQGDVLYASAANTPAALAHGTDGQVFATMGHGANPKWRDRPLGFLVSGALTASTSVPKIYASLPYAMTLSLVRVSVGTAPTGAALLVDVHYHATDPTSATTIFTTGPGTNRPSIAATEFKDDSGAPDVTSLAQNGYISIYVDQVGSTVAGSDLCVWLIPA